MKRTLPGLVICFLVSTLLVAQAQRYGDLSYSSDGYSITITAYDGYGGEVVIPDVIDGLPVTSIGMQAFATCYPLSGVTLPNSVTRIGDGAFSFCTGLASIPLPSSLIYIGRGAFLDCRALTNIAMPPNLASLQGSAFQGCSGLTNLTLPGSITWLGEYAFQGCSELRSVRILSGPHGIGFGAFSLCSSLTNIALPDSVTNIEVGTFSGCASLTSITIPGNVASIEDWVFSDCGSLAGVFFMGSAPTVGPSVFFDSTNVTVYHLPGTTGWGVTFGDRPAVRWDPVLQTSGSYFGVGSGGFGFKVTGTADIPVVIEATTDLSSGGWIDLQSFTLTNGLVHFIDADGAIHHPARFYRVRSP